MESSDTPIGGLDPGALEEIGAAECWQLLATQAVGRVAVIVGHYPLVFPVNYALSEKSILYRTGTGTKLHSIHRSNVTFEVDSIDPVHRSGWSVMVKGVAQELNADRQRAAVSQAELEAPNHGRPVNGTISFAFWPMRSPEDASVRRNCPPPPICEATSDDKADARQPTQARRLRAYRLGLITPRGNGPIEQSRPGRFLGSLRLTD